MSEEHWLYVSYIYLVAKGGLTSYLTASHMSDTQTPHKRTPEPNQLLDRGYIHAHMAPRTEHALMHSHAHVWSLYGKYYTITVLLNNHNDHC